MKVSALKTEKRVEQVNWRSLHIQSYGQRNDYPQRIREIVGASVTGSSCVDVYGAFIFGRGFADDTFCDAVVNARGETADDVLDLVAQDLAMFNGFALHINWNANLRISEVHHIPFEMVRFGDMDADGRWDRFAVHPDWGRRNVALRPFRSKDIRFYTPFNPDRVREEVEAAGGWDRYTGQIYYYSGAGYRCYPMPKYDAAVTDMSTEEGLANVALRNVRNNFLPAGMLIDRNNTANSEEQERETREELNAFQGDTNAGKLFYVNLTGGDVAPEFVPFKANNTDKDFTVTGETAPDAIGRAFRQPPILRCVDVGSNFGADMMRQAYDFYNSVTERERYEVSRVMAQVFPLFAESVNPEQDYSILPKRYRVNETIADRLAAATDKVLDILFDTERREEAKRAVLRVVYGIDENDIEELINAVK